MQVVARAARATLRVDCEVGREATAAEAAARDEVSRHGTSARLEQAFERALRRKCPRPGVEPSLTQVRLASLAPN